MASVPDGGANKQPLTKALCFWDNWEAHTKDTQGLIAVLLGYAELQHTPCPTEKPWLQQSSYFIVLFFFPEDAVPVDGWGWENQLISNGATHTKG